MTPRPHPFASGRATVLDETVDQGLRAYMVKVYNFMAGALGVTGVVAYMTAHSPALLGMFFNASGGMTPMGWVVMLAPLGIIILMSLRREQMSYAGLQLTFWIYAAVMGLSLSWIFIAFTQASITQTFFVTASMFLGMSIYGHTTRRDLSGMGAFLFMGLIGLILASVVNIFLKSSALEFALSVIGVLIFVGLTAWDTQRIKLMYAEGEATDTVGKKAVWGALMLYMDFLNLFIYMLRFMGQRRD